MALPQSRPRLAGALAQDHRRLITRRMPALVSVWILLGVPWRMALVSEGRLGLVEALASLALVVLIAAAGTLLCRRDPTAPRVPAIALGTCLALGVAAAHLSVVAGDAREVLTFILFILTLGAALGFAWGWRATTVLVAGNTVTWAIAVPQLPMALAGRQVAMQLVVGWFACIALAQAYARSFRRSWRHEEAERRARAALAASRDAYRDLAENASDLIYTHDESGHMTYVNAAFARYAGVPAASLLGRSAAELLDPTRPNPDIPAVLRRLAAGEEPGPLLLAVCTDAGPRWLECTITAMCDHEGRMVGVRGIARDVTERTEAEARIRESEAQYRELVDSLRRSEDQLRRLARRQAGIREAERKRLGFDLHDDVCQELVGIGILVASLRRRLAPMAPEAEREFERIGRHLEAVGEHLRLLAHDLRPLLLRDLGLEESLRSLAEGMATDATRVTARLEGAIPRLDEETEIGVYRIAQEALTNALRHAGARAVTLTLGARDGTLALEVRDDGRGFVLGPEPKPEALGLLGMQERALALRARLQVESAVGGGTVVRLLCPIAARRAASAA